MRKAKNYSGNKIGMLTLIERVGTNKWGSPIWSYVCDCGKFGEISIQEFKIVQHHSCGCNSKFNVNPRVKNHILLKAFYSMHDRCYNSNNKNYHNYGGRGIFVCGRWHDFDNYYDDVISTWQKGLTADRIDVNGNYEPSNFRWVTSKENCRNTRFTKLSIAKVEFIRASNLTTQELAVMFGAHWQTVKNARVYKTWV